MDRSNVIFDKKTKEAGIKWIAEKCKGGKFECECCGACDWIVADEMVTPVVVAGDADRLFPSLVVVCLTCGNQKLMNIVVMGLLEGDIPTNKVELSPDIDPGL